MKLSIQKKNLIDSIHVFLLCILPYNISKEKHEEKLPKTNIFVLLQDVLISLKF